jgi:N-acetylglucosaminyldiphosphoundecaprenol N-acetyl-beta-D-mannosaminyltransferase
MVNDKKLPYPLPVMSLQVTPFLNYQNACDCVEGLIESGQKAYSVAINPEKIYKAEHDRELANVINSAQIFICDGIGTVLAVRILHGRSIKRITGVAFFYELIKKAYEKGWKIYLLGASSESNKGAYDALLANYSGLLIVGRYDGYFKDSNKVIEDINRSEADILFVAMGSPKQERWIAENRDMINATFCMGVGGTFDVVSGKTKWAPAVCRKTGTEWLYRLFSEPSRWRRQLALPKFVWLLLKYKLARDWK